MPALSLAIFAAGEAMIDAEASGGEFNIDGWIDAIAVLAGSGADPNAEEPESRQTALHHAMELSDRDTRDAVIALLVGLGADPARRNSAGDSAADYAESFGDGRQAAIAEGLRQAEKEKAAAQNAADAAEACADAQAEAQRILHHGGAYRKLKIGQRTP
jgi:hypothetical protein